MWIGYIRQIQALGSIWELQSPQGMFFNSFQTISIDINPLVTNPIQSMLAPKGCSFKLDCSRYAHIAVHVLDNSDWVGARSNKMKQNWNKVIYGSSIQSLTDLVVVEINICPDQPPVSWLQHRFMWVASGVASRQWSNGRTWERSWGGKMTEREEMGEKFTWVGRRFPASGALGSSEVPCHKRSPCPHIIPPCYSS